METNYTEKTRKEISEYLSKYKRERIAAQMKEPNFIKERINTNQTIKNLGENKNGNSKNKF